MKEHSLRAVFALGIMGGYFLGYRGGVKDLYETALQEKMTMHSEGGTSKTGMVAERLLQKGYWLWLEPVIMFCGAVLTVWLLLTVRDYLEEKRTRRKAGGDAAGEKAPPGS